MTQHTVSPLKEGPTLIYLPLSHIIQHEGFLLSSCVLNESYCICLVYLSEVLAEPFLKK